MYNIVITVKTVGKRIIRECRVDGKIRLFDCIDTGDELVRAELIKLGWTPPSKGE